jgi:drug/metabolite transporter (DMT)-like permease
MLPALIPLAAALLFPIATLALKRAMEINRDPLGTLFVANAITAFAFLPLFALDGKPMDPGLAWQPILAGVLFVIAQAAAYKSFQVGDLSVAVPAQGTKVLMVAGLTVVLLDKDVGWKLWAAAGLTVLAIVLLQDGESARAGEARRRLFLTLGLALLASVSFAAFDVLVQKWSPLWGAFRFGPWAFVVQGLLSVGLLAFPGPRCRGYGHGAWSWLIFGSLAMASITMGLVLVIGLYGKATLVNILFNSRCVTEVIVVWAAGRWFANREAGAGRKVMVHRLSGGLCMLAAIVLALWQPS